MTKANNWYQDALNAVLVEQEFEIAELKAQIAYLESGSKSENNLKMIAELKAELVEAEADYVSAKKYVDSQKKYAA